MFENRINYLFRFLKYYSIVIYIPLKFYSYEIQIQMSWSNLSEFVECEELNNSIISKPIKNYCNAKSFVPRKFSFSFYFLNGKWFLISFRVFDAGWSIVVNDVFIAFSPLSLLLHIGIRTFTSLNSSSSIVRSRQCIDKIKFLFSFYWRIKFFDSLVSYLKGVFPS